MSSTTTSSSPPESIPSTKRNRSNSFVRQFFTTLLQPDSPLVAKPMASRWKRSSRHMAKELQHLSFHNEEEIDCKIPNQGAFSEQQHQNLPSENDNLKSSDVVVLNESENASYVTASESFEVEDRVQICEKVPAISLCLDEEQLISSVDVQATEKMGPQVLVSRIPVRSRISFPVSLADKPSDTGSPIPRKVNMQAANEVYDLIVKRVQQHNDLANDIHRVRNKMAALKMKIDSNINATK